MFKNKKIRQECYEALRAALEPLERALIRLGLDKENEYRPCYVRGRRAVFHRWANSARPQLPKGVQPDENARYYQFRTTHGIVEFEDGTVDLVWPRDIKFADHGYFYEYAWEPERKPESQQEDLGIW